MSSRAERLQAIRDNNNQPDYEMDHEDAVFLLDEVDRLLQAGLQMNSIITEALTDYIPSQERLLDHGTMLAETQET